METWNNFMADLNALVRQQPDTEIEAILWLNPKHYTEHPSGVECIDITQSMNFCLGNTIKYVWRADLKHDNAIEDLKKAAWYLQREIERRSKS